MVRRRFWRNDDIEDVTTQRIHEYEAKTGVSVTLPVPIEQIVEQVLGLGLRCPVWKKCGHPTRGNVVSSGREKTAAVWFLPADGIGEIPPAAGRDVSRPDWQRTVRFERE